MYWEGACTVLLPAMLAIRPARTYAVPDKNNGGQQYIFACRVVVGEYCRGRRDVLTPDIRDVKTQSLYDSTVDDVSDPSIFVTYHDAQVYPEVRKILKKSSRNEK